jgi:hypothetical protein
MVEDFPKTGDLKMHAAKLRPAFWQAIIYRHHSLDRDFVELVFPFNEAYKRTVAFARPGLFLN